MFSQNHSRWLWQNPKVPRPKKAEHKLAPELWHLVVSIVRHSPVNNTIGYDRSALVNLSGVCSHLLEITRPYYYTDVRLSETAFNSPTITLLMRNSELASCIKKFTITMPPVPRWSHQNGNPWPAVTNQGVLTAIFNMSSLEELDMSGSILSFESDQKRFLDHFKEKATVKKLTFFEAPNTQLFPGETFDLPGLIHLTWNSYRDRESFIPFINYTTYLLTFLGSVGYHVTRDGRYWIAFLSNLGTLLEASTPTLTHIDIPFINSRDRILCRLWIARFPELRSLALGDVQFEPEDATNSFVKFLNDHPKLEELRFRNDADGAYRFNLNPSPYLGLNTLPNLHSFEGNTHVFLQLALVRPTCLKKSLLRLILMPNGDRSIASLIEFFTAIIDEGALQPFPLLKELQINLSDWDDARTTSTDVLAILAWWAKSCGPSLEVFSGSLPPVPITSTVLGNILRFFPKLREVHLCEKVIKGDEDPAEETEEDYAANLGRRCPKLDKVVIVKHNIKNVNPAGRGVVECKGVKSVHIIPH